MQRSLLGMVDAAAEFSSFDKSACHMGPLYTLCPLCPLCMLCMRVHAVVQERSMGQARPHVPYRNSMMTTVLRDSLGGNCRTVMIANVNGAQAQMDESISTCRFAERVAKISNIVRAQRRPWHFLCLSQLEGP